MPKGINNKMKKIRIMIIAFILLITNTTVFATLKKDYNKRISLNVAKPILEVIKTSANDINNSNLNGVFCFDVRNYSGSNMNKANMKYQIEIIIANNKYTDLRLVKINGETEENQTLTDKKTQFYTLNKTSKQDDKFKLYINYSSTNYVISEDIKIKVYAVQQ